jgi:hypothetical protein
MDPAIINPILFALPVVIFWALLVTLIAWWKHRAGAEPAPFSGRLLAPGPLSAGALALGVGAIIGALAHAGCSQQPSTALGALGSFPPKFSNWYVWAAAGATLLAIAERRWEGVRGLTWMFRAMAAAALTLALARTLVADWTTAQRLGWLVGFPLLALAAWWGLHRATIRPGPSGPLVLWIIATLTALARVATGSVTGATACAWLAAGCGAVLLAGIIRPRAGVVLAGPGASVLAIVMMTQWFIGPNGSDMALWHMLLLAACPLAAALADLGPLARLKPWPHALVRAGLAAAPALIVLAVTLPQAAKDAAG